MKISLKSTLLFIPLFALFSVFPSQIHVSTAQQGFPSATPTYDPLAEPPLPENPTEFELGRNLYWHWCMTCHGDRGQGLTDEFRSIWDPDHQNCWGRGCHAGHPGDTAFPIPKVVPALVNEDHLSRFSSLQELTDFLKATHPPQSPGILKNDEYHAIALFVFTMNGRSLVPISVTLTPTMIPTPTAISTQTVASQSLERNAIIMAGVVALGVLVFVVRLYAHHRGI
jgi:hypothetical protein